MIGMKRARTSSSSGRQSRSKKLKSDHSVPLKNLVPKSPCPKVKLESESRKFADPSSDQSDEEEMVRPGEEHLSEFERKRLQNLRDNASFFAKLGIHEAKDSLKFITDSTSKPKPAIRGLKQKKEKPEPLPRRSSLRLQRIDPEGKELPPLPPVIVEQVEEHPRKPSGPLQMTDTIINSTEDQNTHNTFLKSLKSLCERKGKSSKTKTTVTFDSLCKSYKSLKMKEERVAKVVKNRIFSLAVHPGESKILACAGDKWGQLGFWDVESSEGQDGVFVYEPHSRPINCLVFAPENAGKLYSSSYDGTVRCALFEKGVFDEIYATSEDDGSWVANFDFLGSDSLIVSHGDGSVAVKDTRTAGTAAEQTYQCHSKSIRTVSVHPCQKHYFATASSDGYVSVWDLRNLKPKKATSLCDLGHGKSVGSAYFSPVSGKALLTTSMDDRLRIYDTSNMQDINQKSIIRHNNQTGRWLTKFRACWHPSREDMFVVGSMARPRQIELFDYNGHMIHSFLDDEYLNSVCSLNVLHPTRNIVIGGNSSGRLHVFMD